MIKKIQKQRVTIVVPTMNRFKLFNRLVQSIINYSTVKVDFVFVNVGENKPILEQGIIHEMALVNFTYTIIKKKGAKVGLARRTGFQYAMKHHSNKIIISADDDCYIGSQAIEMLMAPLLQDKRFGIIGAVGGYKAFYRDFQPDEIRFHNMIGVMYATRRDVIEKVGMPSHLMMARDDAEYHARCWYNGYWVAIVDAYVKHKRHQPVDVGERTIAANNSPQWIKECDLIEKWYPGIFKNRGGKLYKQFKFPEYRFFLHSNLSLRQSKEIKK